MAGFVHLHLHSEYSLLDGACRIADIPRAAKEAGQTAVALTDHGVMYGAVAFYKACKDEGIKPIIGCEVYVAVGSRFDKTHTGGFENNHLILLVKNETGYKNLIYMVSRGFTEGFYSKPRIDLELLRSHSEGLVALSACLSGYIPKQILNDNLKEAESYAVRLRDIFGADNFYLELQNHSLEGQAKVNEALAGISERTGIPLAATNDVHYIKRSDAENQAVLMCIQTNSTVSGGRQIGFETDEFYFKSTVEMERLFYRYKGAIENTVRIADMCDFSFHFDKVYLPVFTPPDGKKPKPYLHELAIAGLERRINNGDIVLGENVKYEDYKLRIEYEHLVVSNMGYAEYYLIVADFVNYAKSRGIPTGPGRGSGAGSLLAYLIGITEVDPIKYNLLFESFLNPQRISMPDFDIDFCYERRGEVIDYVAGKYGADHVAQIVTFGTMAAKAALRDVGRALGMAYSEVDAVVKALPQKFGITLTEALEDKNFHAVYDSDSAVKNLIDIALALEGMPRNASTHAAGVVITDRPLYEYVPLSVNNGTTVTQFDMDTIASLGLLKFDFLALRYLTIISDTEKSVRADNPDFDIAKVPLDDEETYALISSGRTDGVFQLESAGMRQLLVNMQPRSVEDIMIAIALYRPGPMDAIPAFLENRKDRKKIKYKIPALAKILDETCGCIVYQEQVMQIFRTVAGYSYGRADVVRRAISKKKAGVIEKERESFLSGAAMNGYSAEDAAEIYESMTDFANYGFKKSHAAAYAILSFRTAYLKAHYAAGYYSALITSVLDNPPKMSEYITECGKIGIKTLPPDINKSRTLFTVEDGCIRFGLLAIKNVGHTFVEKIIEERELNGEYKTFFDFISRMMGGELNRRQVEVLIKSGAFDSIGEYRSRLLASYERLIDQSSERGRGKVSGQIDMFGSEELGFEYPKIPEFSLKDKLALEKESAGMYFSGHLMDEYTVHAEMLKAVPVCGIKISFGDSGGDAAENTYSFRDRQQVTVAGIIIRRTEKLTRNGEGMAFLLLEDKTGEIELIAFPKILKDFGETLISGNVVAITGEITVRDEEDPKIIIKSIIMLKNNNDIVEEQKQQKSDRPQNGIRLQYSDTQHSALKTKYVGQPQNADRKPVTLYLRLPDTEGELYRRTLAVCEIFVGQTPLVLYDGKNKKYIKANIYVGTTEYVLKELKELLGQENVVLK